MHARLVKHGEGAVLRTQLEMDLRMERARSERLEAEAAAATKAAREKVSALTVAAQAAEVATLERMRSTCEAELAKVRAAAAEEVAKAQQFATKAGEAQVAAESRALMSKARADLHWKRAQAAEAALAARSYPDAPLAEASSPKHQNPSVTETHPDAPLAQPSSPKPSLVRKADSSPSSLQAGLSPASRGDSRGHKSVRGSVPPLAALANAMSGSQISERGSQSGSGSQSVASRYESIGSQGSSNPEPIFQKHRQFYTNEALRAGGFGSYPSWSARMRDAPLMLRAALKRWKANLDRVQSDMRPWFTPASWGICEDLITTRYLAPYLALFPLNEGESRLCSSSTCPNGTLIQDMPTPDGVEMKPFALKHDEADPARITAFELDHIIEVNKSCMRWGEARTGLSTDSRWDSGLTAMEAETLLLNLFAPSAYRWRCGPRCCKLGGTNCHNRAISLHAAQGAQAVAQGVHQCPMCSADRFENQWQLAGHLRKCRLRCLKCFKSFASKQAVQIHYRSCYKDRVAAARALEGENGSQIM